MKLHRLTTQLVAGAILTLPLWVHAAGLGKLTVNSALGQPLSAEIELLVADKSELDSLNATLASGQAFKDAQIEYMPVLSTLQFSIAKDADGKPVLRLSSSRPVNDPFMDMLIELNWASGRLLREYTILLDPPGVAVPQSVSPVAVDIPELKPAAAPTVSKPGPVAPAAPTTAQAVAKPAPAKPATEAKPAVEAKPASAAGTISVRRGDTLAKIADQVRPADVSLEQALVALFHENPQAFAGKNMNRLKAGQSLKVPSAETMAGMDSRSAAREIRLQAADWQAYRAKLAESVAAQPEERKQPASRTVIGKVTPKVEDKAQPKAEEAKDVLKLSRATPPAAAAAGAAATAKAQAEQAKAQAEAEDKAAREKALKESAERAASLEKQIQDMQKLVDIKEKEKEAAAGNADAAAPQAPVAAVAPKVKAKAPVVIPPPEEPSFIDEVMENPIYWIAGGGVVVLGGLLWWMLSGGRLRRKKARQATDNLMTVTDMQPSVVESATTGGVVNTGDTSFLTDFSQAGLAEIDTHDVDPIAEADVYMAYGRDAQAEEILKEALTKSPDRHEIRLKLLEIYAARKNIAAFEEVAGQLYAALGGQPGPIWDKAVEMGRAIDPRNPLYGSTAQNEEPNTIFSPAAAEPTPAAPKAAAEPVRTEAPAAAPEPVLEFTSSKPAALDMDLDLSGLEQQVKAPEAKVEPAAAAESNELDFDLSGFDLNLPEAAPSTAPMESTAPSMDFSGLDLNLNDMGGNDAFDEVSTKLDLARAYLEMGDKDGAREILEEVINEGNAKQKSDAEGIMATL